MYGGISETGMGPYRPRVWRDCGVPPRRNSRRARRDLPLAEGRGAPPGNGFRARKTQGWNVSLFHSIYTHTDIVLVVGAFRIDPLNHSVQGTIVNRTYGTHNDLNISLFLLTIFGPIYYGHA